MAAVCRGNLGDHPILDGAGRDDRGPLDVPGDPSRFESSADSEYRFTGAFWFVAGPIMWSTVPDIEENGARLRAVCGTVFLGGLARLLSCEPPAARIRYSSPRSGWNCSVCQPWWPGRRWSNPIQGLSAPVMTIGIAEPSLTRFWSLVGPGGYTPSGGLYADRVWDDRRPVEASCAAAPSDARQRRGRCR